MAVIVRRGESLMEVRRGEINTAIRPSGYCCNKERRFQNKMRVKFSLLLLISVVNNSFNQLDPAHH